MDKISTKTIPEFVSVLASKAPVPGGGGAAALTGAVGAALGNMVGSLTSGKKKFAGVQADIDRLQKASTQLQDDLLALIDKDAEDFEPLSKAYGLPHSTPDEEAKKAEVMEKCLKDAIKTPLAIMHKCADGIKLCEEFALKGSKLAVSDAACGVNSLKAALNNASLNVFINTKSLKDRAYADKINKEADELIETYSAIADKVFADVKGQLKK
jgi:formiminotetrahydrofolate cyclodeaminase